MLFLLVQQGDEDAAANLLADTGAIIQVLAIGSGVDCGDGSLGSLPRNGGMCLDVDDISDFPVADLLGAKLVEGQVGTDPPAGTLTAFVDDFAAGSKTLPFDGFVSCEKGDGKQACARAQGVAISNPDALDVVDCISFNVIDDQAPAITCPGDVGPVGDDPGQRSTVRTCVTPLGTDNCPGETTAQTSGLASGSAFPIGSTDNVFEVTDAEGAVSSCVFTVTVSDDEPPLITCPADVGIKNDQGQCSAAFVCDAPIGTDNCPGAINAQTGGLTSGSSFPVADVPTVNVFEVADAAGGKASCSFEVTVIDAESPAITCPADVEITNDPGQCSADFVCESPVGTDNCPGATTEQKEGLPSGSAFPVDGPTTNVFQVTDAVGSADTCSFLVTVIDNEAPVATCEPGNNPAGNEPQAKNQDGFFVLGGGDNCGVASIYVVDSGSGHQFGPYPAGTTFKYTEAPGGQIKEKAAPGDVDWKLTGNGDAYVLVTDIHGNTHTAECLVPPKPSRLRHGRK